MTITTTKISEEVKIGQSSTIEDFCLVGINLEGIRKIQETTIGDNAKIRSHSNIYAGVKIGNNFSCGHFVLIRGNTLIGDNVSIGTHSEIAHSVKIESNVRIHSSVFVPEYTHLEEGCWLGPGVILTNAKYPMHDGVKDNLVGPIIGKNAIIGAGARILPGLKIGKNAIIGAGAVVTKNVPEGEIWVGNPAKMLKKSNEVGYKK